MNGITQQQIVIFFLEVVFLTLELIFHEYFLLNCYTYIFWCNKSRLSMLAEMVIVFWNFPYQYFESVQAENFALCQ